MKQTWGDFDDVLSYNRNDLDQDHQAILLHVLHSYIPIEVEKKYGGKKLSIACSL